MFVVPGPCHRGALAAWGAEKDFAAEVHMMLGRHHLVRALAALHTLEERLKQAALARTWWIHLSTNVT